MGSSYKGMMEISLFIFFQQWHTDIIYISRDGILLCCQADLEFLVSSDPPVLAPAALGLEVLATAIGHNFLHN